jgi:two-component system sensor histidine kinase PilS (NtrC family)
MATKSHDLRLERSLRWLIAIRLLVITSLVLPYLRDQLSTPGAVPTFDLLYLLAGLTYLASLVYIALLFLLSGRPTLHAHIQLAGDLLLVTGLVAFFGGIGSPFSLFYLVVIAVASVLLRRRTGLIVATAAYALYAGLVVGLASGLLPGLGPAPSVAEPRGRLSYNLGIHFFGFYAVALLTSVLAESVRRAEAELAAQRGSLANLEVFHRDVVQSISTGLVTTGLEGLVTSVNRAALEILGRDETALLGQPVEGLGLVSREEWERLVAALGSGRPSERTETAVRRGDALVPIGYSLSRLTDARGVPVGTILVFQDLSQWHRLQEELRLRDRMAAAGELASGLAHEVGNPLAAISGSVQLLSSALPANDAQRKLFDIILKESHRLDRTIKGFLRFARPKERATSRFDIAALLAENLALLRNSEEATGRHRFELDLDPPSAFLVGDADQISQIFWNLARNALRAMPDGGTLRLVGRLGDEAYRIEFRDTGRGMSDDQRGRLFQPFQSFFDGGTGIGMAIVYRIVQEHGGRIAVETRPGEGTAIRVELPLRQPATVEIAEIHA